MEAPPLRTDLGWRLDPSVTFLNHGSYGACPEPVLAAQRAWRDRLEAEPVRFLGHDLPGRLDDARAQVAAFLGADPEGLAFVTNATTGVNTVLRSLRLEPGDELLTDDHEYNATINAMRAVTDAAGARTIVARLPFPIAGADDVVETLVDAITPRTRLLLVSQVTSPTGLVLPVERLVAAFAARGIDTLVDGAHAPGMLPVDLDRLAAAYWTGNGHKWPCGPKGSGLLWVRADRRAAIHPLVVSHGANEALAGRTRFRREFDWVGTSDPTAHLALPEAIRWMAAQVPGGWPDVRTANHDLAIAGRDLTCTALRIEAPAPDGMLGSMAALPVPGLATDRDAEALGDWLYTTHRIEIPVGGWPVRAARDRPEDPPRAVLVRLSAQRYNEPADYERLARALVERPGPVAT